MRNAILITCALAACHASPAAPRDVIPHTTAAIVLDAEGDEPDWPLRARRADLLGADGQRARPASEIRLLRDDKQLYVALYAADEDIRSTDAFELAIGAVAVRIDATGAITPPLPGVRAAVDRDGTLDDPHDDDEEWVLEVAIPLAVAGLTPGSAATVRAARCDTTKDEVRRCGAWAGQLAVDF